MKKSEIQKWLNNHNQKLLNKLKLTEWKLVFDIRNTIAEDDTLDQGITTAQVDNVLYEYKTAQVILYAPRILNKKDLRSTLYHEYIHLILSPFTMYYNSLIYDKKIKNYNSTDHNFLLTCEEFVVKHLELLLEKQK